MFGKNIYSDQIPEFPNISEDYFDIKDEKTIQELLELHKQSEQLIPVQGNITNEFRMKQKQLLNIFDNLDAKLKTTKEKPDLFEVENIEQKQISTPFQDFDYYNLSSIEFDQMQAAEEANKYLQQNKNDLNQQFREMQLEGKKKFNNQKQQQHLIKRMELLSFQGQDEY